MHHLGKKLVAAMFYECAPGVLFTTLPPIPLGELDVLLRVSLYSLSMLCLDLSISQVDRALSVKLLTT